MKIIFLNIWKGKVRDNLAAFIKKELEDTDIFCFQEAFEGAEPLCEELLPEYKAVRGSKNLPDGIAHQATYVHNNVQIVASAMVGELDPDIGFGLYAEVRSQNNTIHVCNAYGVPRPGDKLDNPARIKQSTALIDFFKTKKGLKIIGGDFNVRPETKSIGLFAENGYKDLIKDFEITTTRNRLAWERYLVKQYYSDYVFVSPEIKIKNFKVPDIEISDHLPLIVDIEL